MDCRTLESQGRSQNENAHTRWATLAVAFLTRCPKPFTKVRGSPGLFYPHAPVVELLSAVGGIVIRFHGQQPQEIAIAKSRGPARPGDSKRIDRIDALWQRNADDLLPLEPRISIYLIPSQLPDLVQRLKDALPLFLVEPEPGLLEALVI
jgi:hypothetical protein